MMRAWGELAADVLARIDSRGEAGLGTQRVICSSSDLDSLRALGVRYTVTRGAGTGPKGYRLFHWEDDPVVRLIVQRVAEYLGMVYFPGGGTGDWRKALGRSGCPPHVAIFDVESADGVVGHLAAHQALAEDPALVAGIFSTREDLAELAGDLPYLSKSAKPVAVAEWVKGLAMSPARALEVSIPSNDLELLRMAAESWPSESLVTCPER